MSDVDNSVDMAWAMQPLRRPVLCAAIAALRLAPGTRALDAGCGIGLQTLLLAEAVGPAGHVTGLDLSHELLLHAEEMDESETDNRRRRASNPAGGDGFSLSDPGQGVRERWRIAWYLGLLGLMIGCGLMGFVLSFLAWRTGTISWAIIAHTIGGIIMVL